MSENTVNEVNKNKKAMVAQSVKTIAVLVVICLVCCLLLALCNDLLYVSEEEKFNRALAKVYPGTFNVDNSFSTTPVSEFATNGSYGSVLKVHKSTDGDYILKTKGVGGYAGSITLYVAIKSSDATIVGWSILESDGETLLANITDKIQKTWYVGTRVDGDLSLSNNKVSGTTMSSNAINNAINMAAYYCMNALKLGSNPEGEAKEAVLALLGESYAGYTLNGLSNVLAAKIGSDTVATKLSDAENTISYYFTGTGDNGSVQAFVYGEDENRKIVAITDSNVLTSENVSGTEEFVTNVKTNKIVSYTFGSYNAYAMILGSQATENTTVYTVAGLKISTVPNTYVLEVTISNEGGAGKVDNIVATTSGYVAGDPAQANTDKLLTSLVGTTLSTIDGVYSSDKVGGATQSANLITVAVKAALADYDATALAE